MGYVVQPPLKIKTFLKAKEYCSLKYEVVSLYDDEGGEDDDDIYDEDEDDGDNNSRTSYSAQA